MKKPTCTFPSYPFRRVTPNEDVKVGDLFNYRNPPFPHADYWTEIRNSFDWNGINKKERKGWVIIRET